MVFSFGFVVLAQESLQDASSSTIVDTRYKEDQFYFGIHYNLLAKKPTALSQSGFSIGGAFGKILDIPINKTRTFGFGVGLGYALDFVNHNLAITESNSNSTSYTILNTADFSSNRTSLHGIELPLEIRWRTSNPSSYKFWRVYGGLKFGYVFASRSVLKVSSETTKTKGLSDINKLQYGLTLNAGYDTWNIQIYYGLNPIFDEITTTEAVAVDMKLVKIGLIFYLL